MIRKVISQKNRYIALCLVGVFLYSPIATATPPPLEPPSGHFLLLKKGKKAPWSGTLFDKAAMASILAQQQTLKLEFEAKLKYELGKQSADYQLQLDKLQLLLETEQARSKEILNLREEEIKRLREIASEDDHTHWWIAGGFALGVVTAISIFFASVQVAK